MLLSRRAFALPELSASLETRGLVHGQYRLHPARDRGAVADAVARLR